VSRKYENPVVVFYGFDEMSTKKHDATEETRRKGCHNYNLLSGHESNTKEGSLPRYFQWLIPGTTVKYSKPKVILMLLL